MSVADDVAELTRRVHRLEDRASIAQVIASYGPSVDSGSAESTASLWTRDGTYEFSASDSTEEIILLDGARAIAEMVDGATHQGIIQGGAAHFLSAPHIVIDADSAVAIAYSLLLRRNPAGDFIIARMGANRWQLVRASDGWKVVSRTQSMLDGREASRELLRPAAGPSAI